MSSHILFNYGRKNRLHPASLHQVMFSKFQLAQKYFHYYLTASNGKGHGIHSPFVYDFVKNVLNDKTEYDCYQPVEKLRKKLLKDQELVEVEDLGAGSGIISSRQRRVKDIAASSLKSKKFSQLLFRIARYYKPATIIELGTSLGITTSYFACSDSSAKIFTIEGSEAIASIAQQNFSELNFDNISLIKGNFDEKLSETLKLSGPPDLAFIDGNHRKEPTLMYFRQLLPGLHEGTIMIFDDIHWSKEMEEAWDEIRNHHSVQLTIDLFFIGILFFKSEFKTKQHFVIRF